MPIGSSDASPATDKVSTREELLKDARVAVVAKPTHKPERAAQTATDILTDVTYEWYAGAWHGEGF